MGQVFRAYDTETDRVVAIKLLPSHLADDREFEHRFRREARTAAGLNDPHIVPIHSFGEIDGRLYVDMRLIEGRDLTRYIAEMGGRLSPSRTVKIIEQVAAALDSAHRAGLVHRDVKPSNILIANARDFVYLIDFGIARATTDTALTNTGHTMGTLAYLAPERFRGTTDFRADVYSLACVLYECLTGTRPFPGESYEEQITGHLYTPPPQPTAIAPDIPPALDAVVARGLAKDPEARYQSVGELADAARAALNDVTGAAPPPLSSAQAPTQLAPSVPVSADYPPAPIKAGSRTALIATVAGSGLLLIVVAALVAVFANDESASNTPTLPPATSTTTSSTAPPETTDKNEQTAPSETTDTVDTTETTASP
jgi:serine/threonine protein kinase